MKEMAVDKIINRWFQETKGLFDGLGSKSKVDELCLGTFRSICVYLNASYFLHDKGLYFPAMALLRIVSELMIKFLWCLQGADDNEIRERVKRWEKTTIKAQKKFLVELEQLVSDSMKKTFKEVIGKLDTNIDAEVKEMPNTRQLFEGNVVLSPDIYAQAYLQFNQLIHIDIDVINKIFNSPLRQNGCEKDVVLSGKDVNGIKKQQLIYLYMVLTKIYERYSRDTTRIKQESAETIGGL